MRMSPGEGGRGGGISSKEREEKCPGENMVVRGQEAMLRSGCFSFGNCASLNVSYARHNQNQLLLQLINPDTRGVTKLSCRLYVLVLSGMTNVERDVLGLHHKLREFQFSPSECCAR
jgi:hypothetical protein